LPGGAGVAEIWITYLNALDVTALALDDDDILTAVEGSLRAQGMGETVVEPRVHLVPESSDKGHFNVLRGFVRPLAAAGVKTVGDFVDNWRHGLPSELAVLTLFDPETGAPTAILDASAITDMRTGAVTAIGAKHLARRDASVLGHIGARGTAYWNVRLLDHLFDFEEIRVHSRRPESREAFARKLAEDLGKPVRVTEDWRSCLDGADIMIEASRLPAPEPLFRTEWVKPGAMVVPYGTMSAVEITLTDVMDKIVVDDWGQCGPGRPYGSLRRHVDEGKVTAETIHGEIGEIVAGLRPGREGPDETNLFWHRGLSITDIALGVAMIEKAASMDLGQRLRFR
jgi:alanine dehydrogenase